MSRDVSQVLAERERSPDSEEAMVESVLSLPGWRPATDGNEAAGEQEAGETASAGAGAASSSAASSASSSASSPPVRIRIKPFPGMHDTSRDGASAGAKRSRPVEESVGEPLDRYRSTPLVEASVRYPRYGKQGAMKALVRRGLLDRLPLDQGPRAKLFRKQKRQAERAAQQAGGAGEEDSE